MNEVKYLESKLKVITGVFKSQVIIGNKQLLCS